MSRPRGNPNTNISITLDIDLLKKVDKLTDNRSHFITKLVKAEVLKLLGTPEAQIEYHKGQIDEQTMALINMEAENNVKKNQVETEIAEHKMKIAELKLSIETKIREEVEVIKIAQEKEEQTRIAAEQAATPEGRFKHWVEALYKDVQRYKAGTHPWSKEVILSRFDSAMLEFKDYPIWVAQLQQEKDNLSNLK